MTNLKTLTLCFIFAVFQMGCATGPSKSPVDAKKELTQLAVKGDVTGIKNYFDQNAARPGMGYQAEYKVLFVGDENHPMTWQEFNDLYLKQNKAIEQRRAECQSQKEGVDKLKCLTSSSSPCQFTNSSSGTCSLIEKKDDGLFIGLFSIENVESLRGLGDFTSQANLEWYLTELKASVELANKQRVDEIAAEKSKSKGKEQDEKNVDEKWRKFCAKIKGQLVQYVAISPINRFTEKAFWVHIQDSPFHSERCNGAVEKKCKKSDDTLDRLCIVNENQKFFGTCQDMQKTCVAVEGLPADTNSRESINAYISFSGFTSGRDGRGFDKKNVPMWRVIAPAELSKYGIDPE